jgi:4'-phosphopantetheinyl transferase
MSNPPLAVDPWPASRPLFLEGQRADRELIAISIATPDTAIRAAARQQIRDALRDVLSALLGQPFETAPLISQPGQALRIDMAGQCIGLSVSHEPGITLAAIHRHGAVGIDLMRTAPTFDWKPVAHDYLGAQACDRIARTPTAQQPHAFALEWTRFEAGLKCLGLALTEWNPVLERRLACCRHIELELPEGFAGAVAVMR